MTFPGTSSSVPGSLGLPFYFLKKGAMFPFFHSAGILPDNHEFSNMMVSSLVTRSATSFRTLGYVLSSPVDLYTFSEAHCLFC